MKSLLRLIIPLLFCGALSAQTREYTVMNGSPEKGVLRSDYTVAVTLMIENGDGMRFSLYSDNITIEPGKQHTFSIQPPGGFHVVVGSETFKVQTGNCPQMVFTQTAAKVRGNAAACQGVYNVTVWKPLGNDSYVLSADLLLGGATE